MNLQPLNPNMMIALAREDDGEEDIDEGLEHPLDFRIRDIRRLIAENENWGSGVDDLVREGVRARTWMTYTRSLKLEERKGSNEWFVEFLVGIFDLSFIKRDG